MDPFNNPLDPFAGVPGDPMDDVLSLQSVDQSVDEGFASITDGCTTNTCRSDTNTCNTTGCTANPRGCTTPGC